jgi:hypothetical protein
LAAFQINIKDIIKVTGGIGGVYLLLFLPPIMVRWARKKYKNELLNNGAEENCHEMILKSNFWQYLALVCGIIVLVFQIRGFTS